MIPIEHPHCNDILRKPDGMTEEECGDLHIRREDGTVWSFWKPNNEELLALNRGGTVALIVSGETHPPLAVMTAFPTEAFDRVPTEAEYRHRMEVLNERLAGLNRLTKRMLSAWAREAAGSEARAELTDEFLDMMLLNRADGEIVKSNSPD